MLAWEGASVSNSGLFGATPRVIGISVCADDGEDFVGPRWFRPLTTSGTMLGPDVYAEERLGDSALHVKALKRIHCRSMCVITTDELIGRQPFLD